MTENNLQTSLQIKPKRNLLIILAYVLFLYVGFCGLYFLKTPVINILRKVTECTPFLIFRNFTRFTVFLIYYCLGAVMFFKAAVLEIPIKKWFRYFLYSFLLINFIIVTVNLRYIYIFTFNWTFEVVLGPFNLIAGPSLINIILSLVFLKHSGDSSRLVKVLLNKWLIFSVTVIIFLIVYYKSFVSIISYYSYAAFYDLNSFMQNAFQSATALPKPQFPLMESVIMLVCFLPGLLFLISLIKKKKISKLGLVIIIVFILLFTVSVVIDKLSGFGADTTLKSLLLYPEYVPIAEICVLLGMCAICNYEAAANNIGNDTKQME